MAFPILGAVGLGAGLLDSLFGNRSTTMKYAPNAYERQLLSLLQPSLTYQGALGEVQRGLKPQIQGMQNLGRQAGVPYGVGQRYRPDLKRALLLPTFWLKLVYKDKDRLKDYLPHLPGAGEPKLPHHLLI